MLKPQKKAGRPTDSPTSPTLPSDPVQLDVLSLGPLELWLSVPVLGDENIDQEKRTQVPFADLNTCRGENRVLLESTELDLWHPIVMSRLCGFFGSFVCTSATLSRRCRTDPIVSGSSPSLGLFNIYLCLVAIHALRSLKSKVKLATAPSLPSPLSSQLHCACCPSLVKLCANIGDLHIFPTLPHNTLFFFSFRTIRVQFTQDVGLVVDWDLALLAGDSSTLPGKGESIIRLRVSSLAVRPLARHRWLAAVRRLAHV
ncbi:hypothetical protein JCM1841_006244 [Sporobolomyces salmonicolor]